MLEHLKPFTNKFFLPCEDRYLGDHTPTYPSIKVVVTHSAKRIVLNTLIKYIVVMKYTMYLQIVLFVDSHEDKKTTQKRNFLLITEGEIKHK